MGGYGSGGSNKTKYTVEYCRSIDIRRFKREGVLKAGTRFAWHWFREGKATASIGIAVRDEYITLDYIFDKTENILEQVAIEETPCHYGGTRVWFKCPGCDHRAAKLYLFSKVFRCRTCHGLNYHSSQKNGDPFERMDNKIYKIWRRLKGEDKEFIDMMYTVPFKPKNMHWKTYEPLRDELMDLWEQRDHLFGSIIAEKYGL